MTACPALAQQGCREPTITPPPASVNIFTDEQEVDLGDAIAQQLDPHLFLIHPLGQVVVCSYSKGEKIGQVMGTVPVVAKASGLICVRSNPDQLALYDLASMELRREYSFSSPVAFKEFSQDGKRLLVLTADQTAYQLDVSQLIEPPLKAPATAPP
jgi:hypothetical protein